MLLWPVARRVDRPPTGVLHDGKVAPGVRIPDGGIRGDLPEPAEQDQRARQRPTGGLLLPGLLHSLAAPRFRKLGQPADQQTASVFPR